MNHDEQRIWMIRYLLNENIQYSDYKIPDDEKSQWELLRALFNLRLPGPISDEFLQIQDEFLQQETTAKGITEIIDLTPVEDGIYLWQGDITTLRCGAIVNAANSGMTGCYVPGHNCIDNIIHTYAGVQLRNTCAELMQKQGHDEPTGSAKLTFAYNLPSNYVLHTVGPIVDGPLNDNHRKLLASCYRSCLNLAEENGILSVAFCCISTGVFMFPNKNAAEIAVETVRNWLAETGSQMIVLFNVFKDIDREIYEEILGVR